MSYLRNSKKSQKRVTIQETVPRNSKMHIEQNILNYLNQINEKNKLKKISSLNEEKYKKILVTNHNYTGLNENIHVDYERKNKARRSLLYLMNKMSGGTFCPQIEDYFKEIREIKKQEEQLKEVKEEENGDEGLDKNNKKNNNILSNLKSKNNILNYKFNKKNGKDSNNVEKEVNIISKNYVNDYNLKELEEFIDSDEIEKINSNKFNFNKEAQAKKKFLEEYTIDEDDKFCHKKERKHYTKKYKPKIGYAEEEENLDDIPTFKKNAFPTLKKVQFNRMNTISGRTLINKNNFLDKEKNNYVGNYNNNLRK